jgi:hypothetical protein
MHLGVFDERHVAAAERKHFLVGHEDARAFVAVAHLQAVMDVQEADRRVGLRVFGTDADRECRRQLDRHELDGQRWGKSSHGGITNDRRTAWPSG